MLWSLLLFAEEEAKKPAPAPGLGLELPIMLLVGMALFYFMVLRPQRQHKEQQERERLNQLKKNDKVLVLNYIHGQVVSVHDTEDEVVVKLDENFRVKFLRAAVTHNFTQQERLKEAAEAAKAKAPAADQAKDKVAPK
ncbi:MAG: preprotein translocase subunit YajC [Gemmataceae bacterium]|nr:preprotein translocase subunit YajC [Gemmataceae bacterium]